MSANATVDDRMFSRDTRLPTTVLTVPLSIDANMSVSSVTGFDEPALYQSARIFTALASYTFAIKKLGVMD